MQNNLVLCAIIAFVAWYYFAKCQEAEKEYNQLQRMYVDACNENEKSKSRIEDLQSYKNDVTKTFQILDNELLAINDHIKNQNNQQTGLYTRLPPRTSSDRISVLTPDLLQTLFSGMNQDTPDDRVEIVEPVEQEVVDKPVEEVVPEQQSIKALDSMYNRYLIDEEN
jgi:hypothetical protein